MAEYISCNLCGSFKTKKLFYNIVRCVKCGLVYQNPRPSETNITEGFRASEIYISEHIDKSKEKVFKWLLKRIDSVAEKGKLLDVGCGKGFFLRMARDIGWDIAGVEISKSMADKINKELGNVVFEGKLEEARFPADSFNVVTFWDVLDELTDPYTVLTEVKRILRDNGVVLIRVRNAWFHVWVTKLFGKIASLLRMQPALFHLYSFSPVTITKMLKKAGFRDIKVENSILTTGDPCQQGRIFGIPGMNLIKKIMYLFFQIVYFFTGRRFALASSIIAYARK